MKKLFVLIAAAIIIVVAALNVNVSLMTGKAPNISLANVRALSDSECQQPGVSLLPLANYKMAITNTDKIGGVAIKNNNSSVAGYYSCGLDVEQNVVGERRNNIAIRAYAVAPLPIFTTSNNVAYGVYATAGNAKSGYNYGVAASLAGCNNGTALFATENDWMNEYIPGRYAGYFMGAVHVTDRMSIGNAPDSSSYILDVKGDARINGLFTASDSRLKTNVKNLGSSLGKIEKLRPVTYNLKPDDLSKYRALVPDTVKLKDENHLRRYFGLGKSPDVKRQHKGFVAQEVQKVFPELVQEDNQGMLSVNYVELIPVLAGAIQEQQQIIQKQNETIQMLTSRLDALEKNANIYTQENNFSFSLFPNPASSGFVTVEYTMNVDAPICIELYGSALGQKLKVFVPQQNQKAGSYSVQASVSGLNKGAYIVRATSGNQIESKQLIINK